MDIELLLYGLTAGSAGCAAAAAYPLAARVWMRVAGRLESYQQVKVERATKVLEDLFVDVPPTWLKIAYGVGPLAAGALTYLVLNNVWLALVGMGAGLLVPDLWVRWTRQARRRQFQAQLVDALFIFSSSLRAGLSLTQAFEQIETEMSPPVSQEFGLMMKAHRLGFTIDEALQRLNERMPSEELNLVSTAVTVARETGGDITGIIAQLIGTIRERKKLGSKVATLTLQGRLQAYIMSAVPCAFVVFIHWNNPHYFDLMLEHPVGRMCLLVAAGLWATGMCLLFMFSRVEV